MAYISEVRTLRLDQLTVSKQQARTREVEKDLSDLVDNIRVHGQLEPIVVAPVSGDGEKYEIIAGQRRWLAMQQLKADSIMAAILGDVVDPSTASVLSVSENMIRRGLSAKDLIDVCTALYRKYGSTRAVADELGLPYNKVRSYVKFERLRPELKELVESGSIDVKSALRIEDGFGDRVVPAAELKSTVETVSRMTNAQQIDYFRSSRDNPAPNQVAASNSNGAGPNRPGGVRQIIVTLRNEELESLRRWATSNGIGQDKAAGRIITSFLRNMNGTSRTDAQTASKRPIS